MEYYTEKLAGKRLQRCYEIAPPRVKQYLDAEIEFALSAIQSSDSVLELGCGYGRVVYEIVRKARRVVGIDTAEESLELARSRMKDDCGCEFLNMNAEQLHFPDDLFDVVLCLQNGICAFGVEQTALVREALRVTHLGGRAIFSSYSPEFWSHRLEWFELQSAAGLLGEIDREATGHGVIVCRDGFEAGALDAEGFRELAATIGHAAEISEVDESSIFCTWVKGV